MFLLTAALAALLGGSFITSGLAKLGGVEKVDVNRQRLNIDHGLWKAVGALDVLGGLGVLLGLIDKLAVIGILAAVGLIGMTIGAVFYHQKAGDSIKQWLPAVGIGSLAIFYIILRIATL